jgi:hypothetical protein
MRASLTATCENACIAGAAEDERSDTSAERRFSKPVD